ncbi:hypothetical protein Rruber_04412 [Rhodococcus ruber]
MMGSDILRGGGPACGVVEGPRTQGEGRKARHIYPLSVFDYIHSH